MTNDASKMYCVRPPLSDQREVITSDGTRLRIECVGNIGVDFHGISEEQITLCDASYVPDLKFIVFSFHKAQQQTHVIIFTCSWSPHRGKVSYFPLQEGRIVLASDPACARCCRSQTKDEPSPS